MWKLLTSSLRSCRIMWVLQICSWCSIGHSRVSVHGCPIISYVVCSWHSTTWRHYVSVLTSSPASSFSSIQRAYGWRKLDLHTILFYIVSLEYRVVVRMSVIWWYACVAYRRIAFLETVAGVPGMVAAMARHLKSLRRMRRDHGWIHTLLGTWHPMYYLHVLSGNCCVGCVTVLMWLCDVQRRRRTRECIWWLRCKSNNLPGSFACVWWSPKVCSQLTLTLYVRLWYRNVRQSRTKCYGVTGVFTNYFFLAYLISQRYCHRFVGYLEEEAVRTYSKCLQVLL